MTIDDTDSNSRALTQAATAKRRPNLRLAVIIAALVLLPLIVFKPVAHFDFVAWDDPENITNNPLFQPLPSNHFRELLTKPYLDLYIPVTLFVWAELADTVIGAGGTSLVSFNPHKYHLANLVVHILNTLLVFLIVRLLISFVGSGKSFSGLTDQSDRAHAAPHLDPDWAAGFGALLFAVHPLQVEPVAWVTGMKDVLGAFFSFLATYSYLLFATSARRRLKWAIFAGASIFYVLAMFSKPSVVVAPFILLLLEYLSARRSDGDVPAVRRTVPRYRLVALAVWIIAAAPIVLVASSIQNPNVTFLNFPSCATWQRPFVAGDAVTFYLIKLLDPVPLGPDYGRTPVWLMSHGWAYAAILVPLALAAGAWQCRRRAVWPLAALGVFILGMLPVSGLVPFAFQAYSTVADRYVYFAMLGPSLAFACVLMLVGSPPRTGVMPHRASAWVTGAVIIGVLAFLSVRQTPVWSNTTSLFMQDLRVNPESATGYLEIGTLTDDLGAQISDFQKAVDFSVHNDPMRCQALVDLGAALMHEGETAGDPAAGQAILRQAQGDLEEAVRLGNGYPLAHTDLGEVDFYLGRGADAAAEFRLALQLGPNDATVYYRLALLYLRNGHPDLALQPMQKAASLGFEPARQALSEIRPAPGQ